MPFQKYSFKDLHSKECNNSKGALVKISGQAKRYKSAPNFLL